MNRLGFEASGHQGGCRWVAVRHGRSGAGNDHVHVVVDLVREDGRVARTANDFRQLSRLCADMEARYGLSAVEGRAKKMAMPGLTRAEVEKARRTGRGETERAELARVVRAAATVAGSEAEFVRLLRDAGLAARPRYDRVGGHRLVGYAVAEEPSDGGVAVFFGGGKLARDLSLPALRDCWCDSEAERQEAAAEWVGGAPATRCARSPSGRRYLTYRWAEISELWGEPDPPAGARGANPTVPGPVERSDRRPGRSGGAAERCPGRGRGHLARGRLRRGGGVGSLIGALGAGPRATGRRLGPAGPIGPRAAA